MLVWVVGKDGLVGQAMMKILGDKCIGSSSSDADVTDKAALEAFYTTHKPTHLINCTAIVEVDKSEDELLERSYDVNVTGVENLARLAKKHSLKCIHISTDYVFDGTKKEAYLETDTTSTVNNYGRTKLLGEQKLLKICPGAVSIRTASLFGYGKEGLIDSLVKFLQEHESCSFVTDQVSTPTFVEDLGFAITQLLDKKGIFHFVNKGFCSRFELLCFVKELMEKYDVPVKCTHIEPKLQKDFKRAAIRPHRSVLSTAKIEKILDFPIRTWHEALEEFFAHKWGGN